MLTRNRFGGRPTVVLCLGLLSVILCGACQMNRELRLTGRTMGTTYHIKVVAGWLVSGSDLQGEIDQRLTAVNKSMSTYDPQSEINRFNAFDSTASAFTPSDDFMNVLRAADQIYRITGGAWDGTLDPLINLWGFGRQGVVDRIPDENAIRQAMAHVGFERIRLDPAGTIFKADPLLTLDLASIAKGYGVDVIAQLLDNRGFSHFLVEIGGEVYARGRRRDGRPWRVGINRPDKNAALTDVYKALSLTDRAMATSGDYRIFIQIGDHAYAHVLDPRTGRPATNGVVSATVLAPTCTVADGLATALMVMGPEKGVALVNRLASVECLIVVRQSDGSLNDFASDGLALP
ncbi:MAG: FAD:protein FMN transferase [Desulfosarcina sp.]